MTKRKGRGVEQAVIRPEEVAVIRPAESPVAPPAETRWRMGNWSGLPQWNCTACAFDTLDGEAEMAAHWQAHHAPKPPVKLVQAYDARGNPID